MTKPDRPFPSPAADRSETERGCLSGKRQPLSFRILSRPLFPDEAVRESMAGSGNQITCRFLHLPLLNRKISSAALIHQSSTMASAMPMTPIPSHLASRNEKKVRQITVLKIDAHIVN